MSTPVNVEPGYRCPLCPDHDDESLEESAVVGSPICEGCAVELDHFLDDDERAEDAVLDRLEKVTGLTFLQLRKRWLIATVRDFEDRLLPENQNAAATMEMKATGDELASVVNRWQRLVSQWRAQLAQLKDLDA
jgi:hypothetical protein